MTSSEQPLAVPLDGVRALSRASVGGKGWSVNRLRALGLPTPPAVALTVAACAAYRDAGHRLPDALWPAVIGAVRRLEAETGREFGSPRVPLLLAVRSGAARSMPGILDTVLNLGLTRDTETALGRQIGSADRARGLHDRFRQRYRALSLATPDDGPPDDPWQQLRAAVGAVFESWFAPRAVTYRRHHRLSDLDGTAVVMQSMVLGGADERSGTGVVFTRSPLTGDPPLWGEWLPQRQGDDLVSGTHQPHDIAELRDRLPGVYRELAAAAAIVESDGASIQEIEFTVESGRLWLLQFRAARAAPADASATAASPEPARAGAPIATGVCACPGTATGVVVTDSEQAVRRAHAGEDVILARPVTSPDDLDGILAARATVTETGGATSHAAVICRELGRPCVVGCGDGTLRVLAGRRVVVDGTAARIWLIPGESAANPADSSESEQLTPIRAHRAPDGVGVAANPTEFGLLALLGVKGRATIDILRDCRPDRPDQVEPAVARLVRDELVEYRPFGGIPGPATTVPPTGWLQLTPAGRTALAALRETERAGIDREELLRHYREFLLCDKEFKKLVTAWQGHRAAASDGDDPERAYRAASAGLAELVRRLTPLLRRLGQLAPRLAYYPARFDRATSRISAGDRRYLALPTVDSYHTVWFELHQDLLDLTGQRRADERQR